MLKIKHILLMGALAIGVTSCDEYLNQAPTDLLSSDNFYQTASQANQGVLGVYADLRYVTVYDYWNMSEVRSDNLWVDPQPDGQRDYSDIGTFRATSELGTFENAWNTWYKLIYDANVAIQKIPNTTFANETIRAQFLNEAHFLRGLAYFELVRLFGNVPVLTKPASVSEANATAQTAGVDVINNVVIPDLEQALNLPDKGSLVNALGASVTGRADKMAANALLARVYMTLGGYPYNDNNAIAKAKTCLATVLAKKSAYWAPTIDEWRKQWIPETGYKNKYSIFAIQYTSGNYGNPSIFEMTPALPPSYTKIRIFGNNVYVAKDMRYEYDKTFTGGNKDLRGEGYTLLDGYDAETNYSAYTNTKAPVTVDGDTKDVYQYSMFYKFLPSLRKIKGLGMTTSVESSMSDYNDWPVNFPVLRIEDMMLLNAEIQIQDGNISSAMDAVNEIRQRAGCDLVSTSVDAATAMKYVKRERRLELMGEGVRWFDEVRYGTWQTDIKNKFTSYNNPAGTSLDNVADGRYLYPIPQNQMSISPGVYKQNTGY